MDPEFKRTLDLIEEVAETLPEPDRGKQLLYVAKDYVVDGDLRHARDVLARIPSGYYDKHLPLQTTSDSLFADAVAILIDAFGLDLSLWSSSAAGTS